MVLKHAKDGSLHSNASVKSDSIVLGDILLEHHKDQPEEILAIAAHELGHWKYNHVPKIMVINTFYMLVIGAIMIPFIDNTKFLYAFKIRMESYMLSIWLIYMLFKHSIHLVLSLPIKVYQ